MRAFGFVDFEFDDVDKKVASFLDGDGVSAGTETLTHVLVDAATGICAIFDPVLDFDFKSGRTSTQSADRVIDHVRQNGYKVDYIIETHAHADHVSAAPYIKQALGGQLVIGKHITEVQHIFKQLFNLGVDFRADASQFDVLTEEGSQLSLGELTITAMHVPGHTPADMAYVVTGDADRPKVAFAGDTLFAADVGTARCDFPGGDAGTLYDSIQRLLNLADDTHIFLCHDYPPVDDGKPVRGYKAFTTVAHEKAHNKHVHTGVSQAEFVAMRTKRDEGLSVPRLILPSVQLNIRAGELPEAEDNGVCYLKIPLNQL